MALYFSASRGGFFDSEIHSVLPDDKVEITREVHLALLDMQAAGKVISHDDMGHPVAIDPPPPTQAQLNATRLVEIDSLLADIDVKGARPSREIASALAAGQPAPPLSVQKLASLEAQASALRTERRTLTA